LSAFDVSVVIPLYNKEAFVRDMLASVLAQSLPAAEIIIVDDSSTDGSVAKIADLIGGRVRLLSQPNAGPGPARNRGIAEASSAWIAFIDADDQWQPNHLATLAEVAAQCPDAAVVGAGFRRMRADEAVPPADDRAAAPQPLDYLRAARHGEALCSSAVAVRRHALQSSGGFGSVYPGEDLDLWIRLSLDHAMATSPRVTSLYLQRTGGLMDKAGELPPSPQPMFATIAAALAEPRHAAHHADLRAFRDHHLRNGIKQSLYRGEPGSARLQIAQCDRDGTPIPLLYRLLALAPAILLRAALNAFKTARRSRESANP